MSTKLVAKVAVLNAAGEVLLLRRSPTDPRRAGEWDFPGGGVDDGESFAEAAAREAEEEAGVAAQASQLTLLYAATEYYEPQDETVHRTLFLLRVNDEVQVRLSFEHDQSKWVSPEQALQDFPHPFYAVGLRYGLEHGLLE